MPTIVVETWIAARFALDGDAVVMRDTLTWRSPLGFLGVVADTLFVKRHMTTFMTRKQRQLKRYAERLAPGDPRL
jgi:ligand-binding SRPBCC domain-containing protein